MATAVATEIERFTVKRVMAYGPRYTKAQVKKLFGGREEVDVLDVLDADMPPEDKMWLLFREDVIPKNVLRLIACAMVRETPLADGRTVWDLLTDERSRNAVEVAERHARGEATDEELAAAWDAARAAWDAARAAGDAARDAAWAAAWAAARDAAWAAARAAARAADRDADRDAARAAARAAARDAARDAAQIQIIKRILPDELGWTHTPNHSSA